MEATSTWAFGWDALVAIGTLSLALVTAALARVTRDLARASAADVRAQWRPLLLPGPPHKLSVDPTTRQLHVPITNGGRGPATYIRTTLEPDNASPENWSLGSLAPGQEALLVFKGVAGTGLAQMLLDYTDLAGRLYSTAVVLDLEQGPRFYDVQIFEGAAVTHHGPAVRPQPGLRDVAPRPRAAMRQRLRQAWQTFLAPE